MLKKLWGGGNNPKGSQSDSNIAADSDQENQEIDESSISTTNIPESERSSFLAFVKKAMGGIDLSKITAPPFILAPVSILETNAELMCHPEIFSRIAQEDTPIKRFLEYVRWYISRYHQQGITGSGKKPYNPILGEQFLCRWEGPEFGRVELISEQVSHHPPVLGEYYENRKLGIVNMSHFGLKSHFAGTIVKAKVEAHNWTRSLFHDEDYVCTFPTFIIRGFMVANPFFDLVGEVLLHCPTTGYKAVLEFKDKPWFRGEYHQMTGRVFHTDDPHKDLYTLSGNWKKVVEITEVATGTAKNFFDNERKIQSRLLEPLEKQGPMESQKVWESVSKNLRTQNYSEAGKNKNEIEERQRELAKKRAEEGKAFEHQYFYFDEESGRWLLRDYEKRFEQIESERSK